MQSLRHGFWQRDLSCNLEYQGNIIVNLDKLSDTNLACRKIAEDRDDCDRETFSLFLFFYSLARFQDSKDHLNEKDFEFLTRCRDFKTDSADKRTYNSRQVTGMVVEDLRERRACKRRSS